MNPKHLHHPFTLLSYISLLASILSAVANALRQHGTIAQTSNAVAATATEVK